MSAVIRAFPGTDVAITREEFLAATTNPAVTDEVRLFMQAYCGLRESPGRRNPTPVLHIAATVEQGTVHHISRAPKDMAVVTSAEFPEWLRGNGAQRAEALRMATLYVECYGIIVSSLRSRPVWDKRILPTFASSYRSELWPANYDEGAITLPYRGAASLVLAMVGVEALDIEAVRHAPHIASLSNPLETKDVRQLYATIQ